MKKQWMFLVLSLCAVGSMAEARADVASDRVLLVTGSFSGCATGTAFQRVKQGPDGDQVVETTEFRVPEGSYLEITSVEYTTPYSTLWAKYFVQSLALNIQKRTGTASTLVLAASYQNRSMYGDDGATLVDIGQYVSPGAQTHVATFPVGPLMSSAARLCLGAANNFFVFGGSYRVRGRLIPTGLPVLVPGDGGIRLP